MRSALRGPAHQLAVRMRINNCTHGHNNYNYCPIANQPAMHHMRRASNCVCAEGLHFSAFHFYRRENGGQRKIRLTPFTCVEIYGWPVRLRCTCIYMYIYSNLHSVCCVTAVYLTLLASSFLFSTSLIKTCIYRYNTCIYTCF